MKITAVRAIPFRIPYGRPLRFASGEVAAAEHVLVRVHTDEGLIGVAEAPPRPFTYGETQASIVAAVTGLFAPQIVGLSPLDRERVHAVMGRTVGNPAARSAVDMALWDLVGQSLGLPVSTLLGGYTDRVRVAHMLGFATAGDTVAEAERMRGEHGITAFKVKVGRRPLTRDVEVCRALRRALGDEAELTIDGNRGWTAAEAAKALHAMADLDLTLTEELCPADQVLGRRWLVDRSSIPFVADESATTPAEVTREVLAGSATAVSIKTARTGFTVSQRVLFLTEGLGVETVMGSQVDGQIGTLCTAAFAAAHQATSRRPAEVSNFLDMSDDLLAEPLRINNGSLALPGVPGLGIAIDPERLARYRQDR